MSDKSAIEWTDATWNPVTGCTKVSPGCAHCYAEAITLRYKTGPAFLHGVAEIRTHPERLTQPARWKRPRRIFVNSMSDLFHEDVPDEFIADVYAAMIAAPQHVYQILTKRPGRMADWQELNGYFQHGHPPNVWLGTSVENQHWVTERIPELRACNAAVRFLSVEPLLGPVDLRGRLHGIHWVIVGGESGPKHRPMKPDWARILRDQCQEAGVAFFLKQMAKRATIPTDLQIREVAQ